MRLLISSTYAFAPLVGSCTSLRGSQQPLRPVSTDIVILYWLGRDWPLLLWLQRVRPKAHQVLVGARMAEDGNLYQLRGSTPYPGGTGDTPQRDLRLLSMSCM